MTLYDSLKSRILSLVLDFFHVNDLHDEDDFSVELSEKIATDIDSLNIKRDLSHQIECIKTNFFRRNMLSKKKFIQLVNSELLPKILRLRNEVIISVLTLFPEVQKICDEKAKSALPKLEIPEKDIQDGLREILRTKGAYPIPQRFRDTSQEVADIEIFRLKIKERILRIAVVVKGFRSVSDKTITWKDVSHQITRAYQRGQPDHILLVIAKEPSDNLITSLEEYSKSVNNLFLILLVTPIDLAKILLANRFL